MNRTISRSISILLIFAMFTTLFAGTFSVSAAEYSNWGTRHEVCTELSAQAEDYYTGSYTYDSLSSKSGSSLLTALRNLTSNTHSYNTSYDNCKNYAYRSDCQNSDGTVVLLYTSYVASQSDYSPSAPGWNREHVWPKSLGNYNTSGPGADMHHIRPDDVTTNSKRSSNHFGNVSGGTEATGSSLVGNMSGGSYGGGYFEPLDHTKGDVARICLYMHVRYGGSSSYNCDDITNVFSDVDTLLEWNALDPVDTWEMGRNDVVEGIQGNRNPFIDFPELAWLLYNEEIPSDLTTPSGGSMPAYNITAVSNNTSYGTVSISGSKITAFPKYGYYVAGYTVTSGSATVTQDGNTFKVSANSDCTIRINFAEKTSATVSFKQNGVVATTQTGYSEDVITLPNHTGTVPEGYSFIGWLKNTLSETTNKPATIYSAGDSYTLTSSETLYALYSRTDLNGSGTSGEYTLFSEGIVEGDYVIYYGDGAMLASDTDNNNRIDYAEVNVTETAVIDPQPEVIWHIAPTSDGYFTLYNAANGVYAASTGTKNQAELITEVNNYSKWTVTGTSQYEFKNLANASKSVNANLRKNGTHGFACYSTSTGAALTLYKGVSGTVYYTTSAVVCEHANTENVAAVAATCTSVGYTAGVYCNDCKTYISGHAEIAKLDHSYGSWTSNNDKTHSQSCSCGDKVTQDCSFSSVVTDPTATEQGYTTHTCKTCSYSYKDSYTDALGYPVSVNFSVPAGVTKPDAMSAYIDDEITLPSPSGTPDADSYAYKFVGWVVASTDATTTKPTVYAAGSSYTVTGTQTLYALYSYAVSDGSSTGSSGFELLTSTPASWPGEYVLANADAAYVFLADGTTPNSTDAAVKLASSGITLNGTTMTNVPDTHIIVIEAVGGNYAMRLKGAADTKYLMTTNSNSGFNTATSTSSNTALWTLAINSSGEAVISNLEHTSRDIQFNSSSKQFRTYTGSQQPVFLYKGGASASTTYYTTILEGEAPCAHANTRENTVEATCTANGSITTVCTSCGEILATATIPASGHSYTYTDNGANHTVGCKYCSYSNADAHSYTNGTCICGATASSEPSLDTTLKFNMDISAGAEMVVNYNFMASVVSKYTDFYLEVSKNVADGEPIVTTYGISEDHIEIGSLNNPVTGAAILYNAAYTGINAKEMGDNFATTLYAIDANGKIYKGETVVSSIKTFLLGKLSDETAIPELKTMAVDMLKYGAAAQVNFDYDVDNLVTNSLSAEQLALGTQGIPSAVNRAVVGGTGANITTSISVNSKVELTLSCIASGQTNPAGVKCVITNTEGKVLATLSTSNMGGVMYSAKYDNVGAKEMRNVISATFYNEAGTAISKTLNWSVESYVAQTREKATATESEIAVVNAMLIYGDSVAAYMTASGL